MKIEVTHDCLLNCVHCSSISMPESGKQMDWRTFSRVLDEANELGVYEIAFSGGEPLLWEHIKDAISATLKHGIHAILYTTGNAPDAENMMRKLYDIGLKKVIFSIFSPESIHHEAVTQKLGSFEQTIRIVKSCSAMGIETEFHFVPLTWNYRKLAEIAMLANQIGVERISVLRLVPQGRGKDIPDGQLNYSQNIELRKSIIALRQGGHDIRLGSPYNFLMLRKDPQCRSGIDRLTIGPDFRIFPCDAFKHISPEVINVSSDYSNLRNNSLKDCWEKSPYLKKVRQYLLTEIASECKSCHSLEKCNSGCMAQKFYTYGEFIKGPDPMCLNGIKCQKR